MKPVLFCLLLLAGWSPDSWSQEGKPFAVVELFTSEGCNTCPAAEKLFAELKSEAEKNHTNIHFLEYHVDYWNRLGWKDPFSSFQYTNRQKNYTSVLNEEGLYTPMMVVNGKVAFTGSDEKKARSSIAQSLAHPVGMELTIDIDSIARDTLYLKYVSSGSGKNYFIRAVITEDKLISKIGAGENAGKTLTHESVVRVFFSAGLSSQEATLAVPLKKFKKGVNCRLTVFVQDKQTMEIVSVAAIPYPG